MSDKNKSASKGSVVMASAVARFKDSDVVIHTHSQLGDDTIVVRPEEIVTVMRFLRDDPDLKFDMMMDLTVVDYLNDKDLIPYLRPLKARFEVVYHLYSLEKNHRIRVKAPVTEDDCKINSVTNIWPGANWFEREAWDLYGVSFMGHPDLRRILLYEGFEGHPLRKDYSRTKRQPLIGPRN